MKSSGFKDLIQPSIVLLCICLVVTAALAVTYQVTAPVIEAINIKNANIARNEVLPQGKGSFEEVVMNLPESVEELYTAQNGAGVVFTILEKGFGGKITVMVGIDKSGEVSGVKVTNHAETPGLGTKAMEPDYLAQYQGQMVISRTEEPGKAMIDAVTGATITSNAVFRSVEFALAQFNAIGGVMK